MDAIDPIEELKPKLSYHSVIACRRRVMKLTSRYSGLKLKGDHQELEFVTMLYRAIRDSDSSTDAKYDVGPGMALENPVFFALHRTVQSFSAGCVLTEQERFRLACVVAGNVITLRMGVPVLGRGFTTPMWVILFVVGARRSVTPRQKILGGTLGFHVMTGPASGLDFEQYFTDRALNRLAYYLGMVGKWTSRRIHPLEFGQMKCLGKLVSGERMSLEEYDSTPALNRRNAKLVEARGHSRVCERGYEHPCYACHVGFDTCGLATHKYEFKRDLCKKCGDFGYFDVYDRNQTVCQHCRWLLWKGGG